MKMSVTDEEIMDWAKVKYPRPYNENLELMRRAYYKEKGGGVVKIINLREGMQGVTIEPLIVEVKREIKYTGCRNCYSKECKCGKEDYIEIKRKIYTGGDDTGIITIDFAPFIDTSNVAEGKAYSLTGDVKSWKDNLTFNTSKFEEKLDAKIVESVKVFKDYMVLHKNIAGYENLKRFATEEGFADNLDEVIEKAGAKVNVSTTGKEVVLP